MRAITSQLALILAGTILSITMLMLATSRPEIAVRSTFQGRTPRLRLRLLPALRHWPLGRIWSSFKLRATGRTSRSAGRTNSCPSLCSPQRHEDL